MLLLVLLGDDHQVAEDEEVPLVPVALEPVIDVIQLVDHHLFNEAPVRRHQVLCTARYSWGHIIQPPN